MPIGAFRLNTISAAAAVVSSSISATGGTITYYKSGATNYKVHSFTNTGNTNFVVSSITGSPTVDLLLVGGGGSGGAKPSSGSAASAGGGGGGQVQSLSNIAVTAQTYTITVGAGGTAASAFDFTVRNSGGSSSALGYTSAGGGGGGVGMGNSTYRNGADGGNAGGGGGASNASFQGNGGSGTYAGGSGGYPIDPKYPGGGGGGAGAAGATVTTNVNTGAAGGIGVASSITGTSTYYGGGGGGGYGGYSGGSGGQGGGGNGSGSNVGSDGAANTGGGGGGSGSTSTAYAGSNGGSGIAVIRYPFTGVSSYSFVSATTSAASTIAWPSIQAGDLAILVDGAGATTTAPSAVTPTGFTNLINTSVNSTLANRTMVSYKIVAGNETGNITGMNGSTNRKHLFIYRPNTTITQITLVGQTTDSTINAPANQSLDMSLQTGPYIGMAIYMSSGNITTRGSTVTETREINNGSAQTNYTKTFEATSSSVSFANSTISMADYGTNALVSFMLQII